MFDRLLRPRSEIAFAFLRVVVGLLFSFHGMQKVFGILSTGQPPLGSQLWIGGVLELVTGLAVASGILTTCAAIVASGEMAVAYIQFHWRFSLDSHFFPAINKGELAVVYCFVFLYIACHGPGPFSADALRTRRAGR